MKYEKLAQYALCYYDSRNPENTLDGEFPVEPRKNCYCENCFRGKDKLAVIILELLENIETIKNANW